jgi:hypothetical protein
MASATVLFVILVGVVTFKTWPHVGSVLGGGAGNVALQDTATPAPGQAPEPSALNLVKLLGGGAGPATASRSGRGGAAGGRIANGLIPRGDTGTSGGSTGAPSGSGGDQPQGAQQPPSGSGEPRNAVGQAVSGAGNTVQRDTDSLGNTLGGSSGPGLGGVLGGVGPTLNNDLQSLAGR